MRLSTLLASAVLATAVLGSSAAFAIPTTCVAGVCVPTGSTYLDNSLSAETLVLNKGDVLSGVSKITSISDGGLNQTYAAYGAGGAYLAAVFTGFTLANQPAPGAINPTLQFTGGTLKYYVSSADNVKTNLGSAGADIANVVNNGQLWASFNAIPDKNGFTLTIDIQGGTASFTGAATDFVFLDVDLANPGLAGLLFDTASQLDTNGVLRDMSFSGTASAYNGSPCSPDLQVCGANSAKSQIAIPVPEPVTVSLFGAGLVGAAALRRRKAKKA